MGEESVNTCRCHEETIHWCGRHGEPLKGLLPDDRVMNFSALQTLRVVRDVEQAELVALTLRRYYPRRP